MVNRKVTTFDQRLISFISFSMTMQFYFRQVNQTKPRNQVPFRFRRTNMSGYSSSFARLTVLSKNDDAPTSRTVSNGATPGVTGRRTDAAGYDESEGEVLKLWEFGGGVSRMGNSHVFLF